MIYQQIIGLKQELKALKRHEVVFILCAMLCGFLICADYSLVRPVSNAVFLTEYGAQAYPYAWLALVPFSLLIISIYNRLLPKYSCIKLLTCIVSLIIIINLIAVTQLKRGGGFPFVFYVWKDIYVLLLFQQLWGMIHTTITIKRAQFLYGIFFASGALGSILGSLIPGFFALKMGSEHLLIFSAPCLIALIFCYRIALTHSNLDAHLPPSQKRGLQDGIKQIAQSRILLFIFLIVVLMQVASTLLDFQFNSSMQTAITLKDLRTEYMGRTMSVINTLSFCIQLGGGFLLLATLGIKRAHLLIPFILLINAVLSLIFPVFSIMTFSFITIKAFDFSLFVIVKEMLYIPLKTEEKFHAKSVIDVFAYRAAKGVAALIILSTPYLSEILITLLLVWMASSLYFLRKQQKFVY